MKLKIAVLNDIHAGKSFSKDGHMRAASELVESMLSDTFEEVAKHNPDIVINMGDLIRKENTEKDLELYRKTLERFSFFKTPLIHMLGNHEITYATQEQIETIWKECGFPQKSYGEVTLNGVRILWLGMEAIDASKCLFRIPNSQLDWLDETLSQNTTPALLFSHFAVDSHNVSGNFFYNGSNQQVFFFENQLECQSILRSHRHLLGVFQAHLHYFNVKWTERLPYFTLPALIENICAPNQDLVYPGVFSIIELHRDTLDVQAYSGKYRFSGAEIKLN